MLRNFGVIAFDCYKRSSLALSESIFCYSCIVISASMFADIQPKVWAAESNGVNQ